MIIVTRIASIHFQKLTILLYYTHILQHDIYMFYITYDMFKIHYIVY